MSINYSAFSKASNLVTVTEAELSQFTDAELDQLCTYSEATNVACTARVKAFLANGRKISVADIGEIAKYRGRRRAGALSGCTDFAEKCVNAGGRTKWYEDPLPPNSPQGTFPVIRAVVQTPNVPAVVYYNAPVPMTSPPPTHFQLIVVFTCSVLSIKKSQWVLNMQDQAMTIKAFQAVSMGHLHLFRAFMSRTFTPPADVETLSGASLVAWFTPLLISAPVDFYALFHSYVTRNILNLGEMIPRGDAYDYLSPVHAGKDLYKEIPISVSGVATRAVLDSGRDYEDALLPIIMWNRPCVPVYNTTDLSQVNVERAYNVYATSMSFRGGRKKGMNYFLNSAGTCGLPSAKMARLEMIVSIILGNPHFPIDVYGISAEQISFVEASLAFFDSKCDIRYVAESGFSMLRSACPNKVLNQRRPNSVAFYVSKNVLDPALKGKDRKDTTYKFGPELDRQMNGILDAYSGQFMALLCCFLPTVYEGDIRVFRIRAPFDALGLFSNCKSISRAKSLDPDTRLLTFVKMDPSDSLGWARQVVGAVNGADASFLNPYHGREIGYANLIVPVKQVTSYETRIAGEAHATVGIVTESLDRGGSSVVPPRRILPGFSGNSSLSSASGHNAPPHYPLVAVGPVIHQPPPPAPPPLQAPPPPQPNQAPPVQQPLNTHIPQVRTVAINNDPLFGDGYGL